MENVNNEQQQLDKRPSFLTVLCVLTLIVTSIGGLGTLLSVASGKLSPKEMEKSLVFVTQMENSLHQQGANWSAENMAKLKEMTIYLNEHHELSTLLNFITFSAGIAAVVLMLRRNIKGFHLYIIYSLFSVFGTFLIVPMEMISPFSVIVNSIVALIFILMYSRNLHWMK
jgi:hypothetical protein